MHGSTHEKPLTLFSETEKHLLTPLPMTPPELATWTKAKVQNDGHIQYLKCRYSVPYQRIHQILWLRVSETSVRIYHEHEMIAMHVRLHKAGSCATNDQHLPPNAKAYLMMTPAWCLEEAQKIGEACCCVVKKLLEDSVVDYLRAAQGVISLAKKYGYVRLNAACHRALVFHSPRYATVKKILTNGAEYELLPEKEAFDLLATAYTQGRFIRKHGEA